MSGLSVLFILISEIHMKILLNRQLIQFYSNYNLVACWFKILVQISFAKLIVLVVIISLFSCLACCYCVFLGYIVLMISVGIITWFSLLISDNFNVCLSHCTNVITIPPEIDLVTGTQIYKSVMILWLL